MTDALFGRTQVVKGSSVIEVRRSFRIILALIIATWASASARCRGDTVVLHSGQRYEGTVVVASDSVVTIDTEIAGRAIRLDFKRWEVKSILREPDEVGETPAGGGPKKSANESAGVDAPPIDMTSLVAFDVYVAHEVVNESVVGGGHAKEVSTSEKVVADVKVTSRYQIRSKADLVIPHVEVRQHNQVAGEFFGERRLDFTIEHTEQRIRFTRTKNKIVSQSKVDALREAELNAVAEIEIWVSLDAERRTKLRVVRQGDAFELVPVGTMVSVLYSAPAQAVAAAWRNKPEGRAATEPDRIAGARTVIRSTGNKAAVPIESTARTPKADPALDDSRDAMARRQQSPLPDSWSATTQNVGGGSWWKENSGMWFVGWLAPPPLVFLVCLFPSEIKRTTTHRDALGRFLGTSETGTGEYLEPNPQAGLALAVFWFIGYPLISLVVWLC